MLIVSMFPVDSGRNIELRTSTTHPPIYIDGNIALDAYVSGNGTDGLSWNTAHVLENYEIDCNNVSQGIYISNINRFLIIRNCDIIDGEGGALYGAGGAITLDNCSNVKVTECNLHDNYGAGIKAMYSDSLIISDNTITDCVDHGIVIERTEDSLITGNVITHTNVGIYLLINCHYNNITDNTVSISKWNCIGLAGSNYCNIYGNTVSNAMYYGIYLDSSSEYNEIHDNVCCDNVEGGAYSNNLNNNFSNNGCPTQPSVPGYIIWVLGFSSMMIIYLVQRKSKKN